MQPRNNKNASRIINLREYREGKASRKAAEQPKKDEEDILTQVSYYLLMAARTIAGQRKH